MEYFLLFVLCIMIICAIHHKKYFLNPVTIFASTWFVIVFLTSLQLYDMREYTDKTLWMILLANIGFFVGCISNKTITFGLLKRTGIQVGNKEDYIESYELNKSVVYGCLVISFLSIIIIAYSVIRYLFNGISYAYVRDMLFGYGTDTQLVSSDLFMLFFIWVVSGIVYVLMPIALVELFENKKKKGVIIGGLLVALLYTFATAGRATIFVLAIQLIVLIWHYKFKLSKKVKKFVWRSLIIIVVILFIISSYRSGDANEEHISSFYSYFSISVPLLSHWTEFVDTYHLTTHGGALLYGVLALAQWILQKVGIFVPGFTELDALVNMPQNEWIYIFYNPIGRYNAFSSAIYYFYLDFGMMGVFIIPIVLGVIVNNVFNKMRFRNNKKSLFYYLIIVQMLVLSFIKLQTSNPPYIIALIVLAFAVKGKRIIRREETI